MSGFTVLTKGAGNGNWYAYSTAGQPPRCGFASPTPSPPQGEFAATATGTTLPNSVVLYQDIALEPKVRHALSFTLYYRNGGTGEDEFHTPETLDPSSEFGNQQYRVDLLTPSADPFSVASDDVLARLFRTEEGDPATLGPTPRNFDLSPYAGKTVRLRFAQVQNLDCFEASVDAIRVRTGTNPPPPAANQCTIPRGSGNDVIRGTPGHDVICAGAGKDVVYGRGGNDTIRGGGGNQKRGNGLNGSGNGSGSGCGS